MLDSYTGVVALPVQQYIPLYLVDRASLMHGQPNIKIKVRGFDYVDKKITVSEPVLQ